MGTQRWPSQLNFPSGETWGGGGVAFTAAAYQRRMRMAGPATRPDSGQMAGASPRTDGG